MAVIDLIINGELHKTTEGTTLGELLESLGVRRDAVVVEHNGTIVESAAHETVRLQADDRLEIVRFVAGG
ncbi:MAG: hypothetical protein Kow0092_31410 [Deferrisomatales bacterium]